MARVLAVDPGLKRIGLALSDPLRMIASPYQVVEYKGTRNLALSLKQLVAEKEVELVVIGYPHQEDEEPTPIILLAEKLKKLLEGWQIKVVFWDEHYTSSRAADILRSSGIKAKNMKGKLDKIAASLLLEDYLQSSG